MNVWRASRWAFVKAITEVGENRAQREAAGQCVWIYSMCLCLRHPQRRGGNKEGNRCENRRGPGRSKREAREVAGNKAAHQSAKWVSFQQRVLTQCCRLHAHHSQVQGCAHQLTLTRCRQQWLNKYGVKRSPRQLWITFTASAYGTWNLLEFNIYFIVL